MRRMVFILAVSWIFVGSGGAVLGQDTCRTPVFITAGVSPNVLVVFDSSGSMSNTLWVDEFDALTDYATPLLPQGKTVVFARETSNCFPDHHRVTYQTAQGKVKLRYRNYTSPTELCSGSDYETRWSEADGFFYFDRSSGRFIIQSDFQKTNPDHIKVFLPYATYSLDVSDTGQYSTWYNYNYLNWIFYHSNQSERDAVKDMHDNPAKRDLLTRILTAKKAVKEAIGANPDMRFGLMRFDGTKGGKIIAPIPSSTDTVNAAIDGIWAGGGTPLAETLEDAWDYFSDSEDSPIEHWCQKSFVILMTDGLPTWDANDLSAYIKKDWDGDSGGTEANGWAGDEGDRYPGSGSDYLDDIAYYMYQNDASGLDGTQNVSIHTIGFVIHKPLLLETALNGNGLRGREDEWDNPTSPLYHKYFYTAGDFEGLREALGQAMKEISRSISSGTAVATVSTATSAEDLVFRTSFHPVGWKGFLEAFDLTGDQDFEVARWQAGELLQARDPEDRQIYTALKSATGIDNKLEFVEANVGTTGVDDNPLFKLLDTTNANDGKDIIRFIRGADVTGFRERNGYKLGDIVNSTPVVVGAPDGHFNDSTYIQFRHDHRLRERMLYVGANDGMLHAFHVDDPQGGNEAWAFIPSNLLGKLKGLTSPDYDGCHEYFVDLPPTVVDVFIDPDGLGTEPQQWRTLLIGGEREGGKAYFALDVTDPGPDQFKPMWEFSDPLLGESWSIPAVEKIDLGGSDRWLGFVGNGPNNDDNKGYLFAIDLESGENFRGPFDLGPISPSTPNALASPKAVDINEDDYADSLFAGDLHGRVWRFNITDQGDPKTYEPLDPGQWAAQEIFHALPDQPITQPVGLSFYCSGPSDQRCENLMIYFGTGKFVTPDDKTDTSLQSFYAIKDEFSGVTRDDPDMKNRTTSVDCEEVPDPYQIKGWYVDLTTPKERVSSPPLVLGGLVFFLTFIPDDDACSAGGETWLYYREFDTGCVPNQTVSGKDPDPPGEARPVGKILIGPGYAPSIVYYATTQDMLIQTSDRTVHRARVTLPRGGLENYSWREVFY